MREGNGNAGKNVFRELEKQNPAVARVFGTLRRHGEQPPFSRGRTTIVASSPVEAYRSYAAYERLEYRARYRGAPTGAPIWSRLIAAVLLLAGIVGVAITVGPALIRLFSMYWQAVLLPTAGVCLGAGAVLLVSRIGASPLSSIAPPRVDSEDPLQELKDLAERTASRLRSAYRLQLSTVLAVGSVFIILIAWSMLMVSQERILYASAFGSGSVAMAILTQWKWQPFDRINEARRLADNADTLATGLRLRMKTISEIIDPSERAKAQWLAVEEYLKRS